MPEVGRTQTRITLLPMAKKKKKTDTESTKSQELSENDPLNFEESLSEVESIVSQLESGSLGLSESLEQYETGIRQLKRCHELLDAAEQRVSVLAGFDVDGNPIVSPLSDEDSGRGTSRKANTRGKAKSKKQPTTEQTNIDNSDGSESPESDEQLF